jgi:hypothetical protein
MSIELGCEIVFGDVEFGGIRRLLVSNIPRVIDISDAAGRRFDLSQNRGGQ